MKWVIVKTSSSTGLGDRIRAVLSALHYAGVTGRGIQVCWDDGLYGEIGRNVFPQLFELSQIATPENLHAETLSVFPTTWRGHLHDSMNGRYAALRKDNWDRAWALKELSFDQSKFDYEEDILVIWDFDGFVASWNAAEPAKRCGQSPDGALHSLAKRHLQPSSLLRNELSRIKNAIFKTQMIGVHVRRANENAVKNNFVPYKRFFGAIDTIKADFPEAGLFLATDNREVESVFRDKYPDVVVSHKWLAAKSEPLHLSGLHPDRLQGAREAMLDILLLAACDFLVYPAASSFSLTARIFGGLPENRIFPLYPESLWQRCLLPFSIGKRRLERYASIHA
jgi:hypothetical protein